MSKTTAEPIAAVSRGGAARDGRYRRTVPSFRAAHLLVALPMSRAEPPGGLSTGTSRGLSRHPRRSRVQPSRNPRRRPCRSWAKDRQSRRLRSRSRSRRPCRSRAGDSRSRRLRSRSPESKPTPAAEPGAAETASKPTPAPEPGVAESESGPGTAGAGAHARSLRSVFFVRCLCWYAFKNKNNKLQPTWPRPDRPRLLCRMLSATVSLSTCLAWHMN